MIIRPLQRRIAEHQIPLFLCRIQTFNGLLPEKPSVSAVHELLLHETIHTIITSYVNDVRNHGTETYKNLQELFNIATLLKLNIVN